MLRHFFLYLSHQKKFERWLLRFSAARKLARQFVAGETLPEAMAVVASLNRRGLLVTLDHLGENVRSLATAAAARDDYCRILEAIAREQLRSTISVKLTQLGLDLPEEQCRANLETVVACAQRTSNFVQVDMESSAHTDRTLALVQELHQRYSAVGAVIQAYLHRSENDIRELLQQNIRIRLCKGAYQEPPAVAFQHNADVDRNYILLMRLLLDSRLFHSIATHDHRIIAETRRYAKESGLPKDAFEFQMLYGVRRPLQQELAQQGYRLRIYVPFGREWFPYYMRRLAERPANVLFALRSLWG